MVRPVCWKSHARSGMPGLLVSQARHTLLSCAELRKLSHPQLALLVGTCLANHGLLITQSGKLASVAVGRQPLMSSAAENVECHCFPM